MNKLELTDSEKAITKLTAKDIKELNKKEADPTIKAQMSDLNLTRMQEVLDKFGIDVTYNVLSYKPIFKIKDDSVLLKELMHDKHLHYKLKRTLETQTDALIDAIICQMQLVYAVEHSATNIKRLLNNVFTLGKASNPVRDFITKKEWDGIPRVDNILNAIQLVNETDELRAYLIRTFKRWFVRSIVYIIPNTDKSYPIAPTPLLRSLNQGAGKSRFTRELVPLHLRTTCFADVEFSNKQGKDKILGQVGKWIQEYPEMDSYLANMDGEMKNMMRKDVNSERAVYGREESIYDRTYSCIITSNQQYPLGHDTENRVVACFDVQHIKMMQVETMADTPIKDGYMTSADCDIEHSYNFNYLQQVWAEVYALYNTQEGKELMYQTEQDKHHHRTYNLDFVDPTPMTNKNKSTIGLANKRAKDLMNALNINEFIKTKQEITDDDKIEKLSWKAIRERLCTVYNVNLNTIVDKNGNEQEVSERASKEMLINVLTNKLKLNSKLNGKVVEYDVVFKKISNAVITND